MEKYFEYSPICGNKRKVSGVLFTFVLTYIILLPIDVVLSDNDSAFECGGAVEAEVWGLWDHSFSNYLKHSVLHARLMKQGDVYALYDFQTYTHNLVSMARRCGRTQRLREIAALTGLAYPALEAGKLVETGRSWVCRGGRICNDKNRLINTEVKLCSLQFLGVASSVANALTSSKGDLSADDKAFIKDTVLILLEHLLRWSDSEAIQSIQKAKEAKLEDVKDGSSTLFFTDKPLWLITIYAELAGILRSRDGFGFGDAHLKNNTQLSLHFSELLQFFSARTAIRHVQNDRLGDADLADLDRGYWRRFAANRYAGYEKAEKPAVCVYYGNGKDHFKIEFPVSLDSVPILEDTGWDISHARRLVHTLDALERNREALKNTFHLTEKQLPPLSLTIAFANTLVGLVWNGDKEKPLFSNYWSGANGWFRVGWDNGTGECREGIPPHGLNLSFLEGGYLTWARYQPIIGLLGQRLYGLISSPGENESDFISKYYPSLNKSASSQNQSLSKFMFLPSLVGVINQQ